VAPNSLLCADGAVKNLLTHSLLMGQEGEKGWGKEMERAAHP